MMLVKNIPGVVLVGALVVIACSASAQGGRIPDPFPPPGGVSPVIPNFEEPEAEPIRLTAPEGTDAFPPPEGLNPVIPDFDAPVRIARPAMPQPPEVPPSLSESLPITVRFIRRAWVEGRLAGETVATIARTDQRLHMRSSEDREWLFIRNPVDQRRVRALLVDHEAQLILGYEESDLNLEGVAADWLSAASLGVPADLVDRMARTGERAAFGELNATRFLPPSDAIEPDMPNELWWSEEDHLPVLAVYEGPGGRVELSVELVGRSVDSTLIQDSAVRYPSYAAMDLADWREERH